MTEPRWKRDANNERELFDIYTKAEVDGLISGSSFDQLDFLTDTGTIENRAKSVISGFDLDNLNTSSFWHLTGNPPNRPDNSVSDWLLKVIAVNSTNTHQYAYPQVAGDTRIFFRTEFAGTFGPWREVSGLTPLAAASVSGDGNQPNTILTLTSTRADAGWSIAGNAASFSGNADRIRIEAMAFYDQVNSNGEQRIAPVLELLKNGTVVAKSATGYQRHFSNHHDSSNTIVYTDPNPGSNPQYQLRAQQGSDQNEVVQVDIGHFTLEAI